MDVQMLCIRKKSKCRNSIRLCKIVGKENILLDVTSDKFVSSIPPKLHVVLVSQSRKFYGQTPSPPYEIMKLVDDVFVCF